jgi:hypothetical protein
MRSVWFYLADTTAEQVGKALSDFAPQANPKQWLYPNVENPVLYIELSDLSALKDDELLALERALGKLPEVTVLADVSGRVPGVIEVQAFVYAILPRFRGVATDDYTSHLWTFEEIQAGERFEGHTFFKRDEHG